MQNKMISRLRLFILMGLLVSGLISSEFRPCFATEIRRNISTDQHISTTMQIPSRSYGDSHEVVEKLSPFRNCTGNPFYAEGKQVNPEITVREKSSGWSQPSTAGHQITSFLEKITDACNLSQPRVIPRYPGAKNNVEQQQNVAGEISSSEESADGLFSKISNVFSFTKKQASPGSAPIQGPRNDLSQSSYTPGDPVVIVLDPGHGGTDPGAVSSDGLIKEKDLTMDLAKRVKAKIEHALPGSAVALTRNKDMFLSLQDRIFIANSMKADVFISIHCNGSGAGPQNLETYFLGRSGSQKVVLTAASENGSALIQATDLQNTFVHSGPNHKTDESAKLGAAIHLSTLQSMGQSAFAGWQNEIKPGPFYVLLGAKMPSVLIECGLINARHENLKLTNPDYRNSIADGLASGIIDYLKSRQIGEKPTIARNIWQRLKAQLYGAAVPAN